MVAIAPSASLPVSDAGNGGPCPDPDSGHFDSEITSHRCRSLKPIVPRHLPNRPVDGIQAGYFVKKMRRGRDWRRIFMSTKCISPRCHEAPTPSSWWGLGVFLFRTHFLEPILIFESHREREDGWRQISPVWAPRRCPKGGGAQTDETPAPEKMNQSIFVHLGTVKSADPEIILGCINLRAALSTAVSPIIL